MLSLEERVTAVRRAALRGWDGMTCIAKVNCSFGAILTHKTNDEFRYFHASSNNATVFDTPTVVRSRQDMEDMCNKLSNADVERQALNHRPNTSWKLRLLSSVSFYMYKTPGVDKVGAGKKRAPRDTPTYLANCGALRGVTQVYDDNLCFLDAWLSTKVALAPGTSANV